MINIIASNVNNLNVWVVTIGRSNCIFNNFPRRITIAIVTPTASTVSWICSNASITTTASRFWTVCVATNEVGLKMGRVRVLEKNQGSQSLRDPNFKREPSFTYRIIMRVTKVQNFNLIWISRYRSRF
jgi:hypothetical protein